VQGGAPFLSVIKGGERKVPIPLSNPFIWKDKILPLPPVGPLDATMGSVSPLPQNTAVRVAHSSDYALGCTANHDQGSMSTPPTRYDWIL
jgi:hypothetical protein